MSGLIWIQSDTLIIFLKLFSEKLILKKVNRLQQKHAKSLVHQGLRCRLTNRVPVDIRLVLTHVMLNIFYVQHSPIIYTVNLEHSSYPQSGKQQTWGELIVNANALLMHYFFQVIQGND